jgi:GTPase SAR1 family protein
MEEKIKISWFKPGKQNIIQSGLSNQKILIVGPSFSGKSTLVEKLITSYVIENTPSYYLHNYNKSNKHLFNVALPNNFEVIKFERYTLKTLVDYHNMISALGKKAYLNHLII